MPLLEIKDLHAEVPGREILKGVNLTMNEGEVHAGAGKIVNGFCKEVFAELPMEFAVEAKALLEVSLEGSVG